MSKEAALRAMREARYAERSARPAVARPTAPVAPPPRREAPVETPAPQSGSEVCGHRSMNGRTCTREQGHTAKNHRYS